MRRRALVVTLVGFAFGGFSTAIASAAENQELDAATIKAGLRTATPEEGGFVERVVALRDEGVLPESLVASVFQWARRKDRHRFQYFKRALVVQAEKIGVRLT